MNRIITFMLLDFRSLTVKDKSVMLFIFIVNMIFFFGIGAVINVLSTTGLVMLFTVNMFNLAEKNKLETLHAALPLTRDDIVKARYLFLVCALVIVLFPLLLMKLLFFPNNEKIYFYIAVAFLTTSFLTSLTYPFCFKIGVAKMQGFYSLFFVLFFVTFLKSQELRGQLSNALSIFTASPVKTIAAGLILLYLSYLLSLKIYRTRDL